MPILLADNLTLPADAPTQTLAFLARRGGGKSYAATLLCEQMLDAGAQVVALDPVGIWYGVRLLADGVTPSGYQIPVFGGLHGDLPLDPAAGRRIADLIVDHQLSAILDVSMLRKGDRKRFAADFGEQLFQRKKSKRSPLHLFVEEAQVFVPERLSADEARMAGAFEDLIRLGRNFGIGASLISQRPQSVNKEVLNQTECLFVLQITGEHERKAIERWVVYQGANVREMVNDLPSLPRGTAYVWSPQWLRIAEKVEIHRKRTYDASATPEVGDTAATPGRLASLDLDALRGLLAEVEAPTDDPAALKAEVERLRRQLRERPAVEPVREQVLVPMLEGDAERIAAMLGELRLVLGGFGKQLESLESELRIARGQCEPAAKPASAPAPTRQSPAKPKATAAPSEGISGPQQRILDAIATFETLGVIQPAKSNVAIFAGQSPSSGGYTNNLGRLRTLGLIEYPRGGHVALTSEGRALTSAPVIRTQADLHEGWCAHLPRPQANILRLLIEAYPAPVQRDWLAATAGQSANSGGYTNNLGRLRSLGLIDYPNSKTARATELLFPKGTER